MRVPFNGYIVPDDDAWIYRFFGFSVFSPADIRAAIQNNPENEDLILEINSPGGSVWSGFEMYSVLKAAAAYTVAEVQSLAASAASTMMLGCRKVLASPVAQVMMHLPSVSTEGNQTAHGESIKMLNSITESILNGYETKSAGKKSRTELAAMMTSTTWLSAQEALDAGLIDGILYQEESVSTNVINAVGGSIRALANAGGLPDSQRLRAEYQAMQARETPQVTEPVAVPGSINPEESTPAGGTPAEDNDGWQAQAMLDIEMMRF